MNETYITEPELRLGGTYICYEKDIKTEEIIGRWTQGLESWGLESWVFYPSDLFKPVIQLANEEFEELCNLKKKYGSSIGTTLYNL